MSGKFDERGNLNDENLRIQRRQGRKRKMKFYGMSKNKFLDDLATKTGKNGVELYRYVMGLVNKAPRGGERYGNFDAEEAFRKAIIRSYGEDDAKLILDERDKY